VCYRAFNERSGMRFGGPGMAAATLPPFLDMYGPYGLLTPASWVALHARRYMHEYGVTNEDFGRISVVDRRHAATNPAAWFYQRPITLADHQSSRWIVEPVLRLLDCCQETDGGVAIVVTTPERALDLRQPPVAVVAAAQSLLYNGDIVTPYHRPDLSHLDDLAHVAEELWGQSGLGVDDIDAAMIYEHFSPIVFMQLEALGFCAPGEAKDFVAAGSLALGGRLPTNTHGGHLGEAYLHGMNHITEAVRQLRGTAANQLAGPEHVIVSSGMSGAILGRIT
jgi:acetyl-CoA acetyltransferase